MREHGFAYYPIGGIFMKRCIAWFAAALSLALVAQSTSAQEYRYVPFRRVGTPALRSLKVGASIGNLMESYGNEWCAWATSTLPAEGKRPPKPASFKEPEDEWTYDQELAEWETMYAPDKAQDGDVKTAWCEGAKGPGVGEALAIRVEPARDYVIFSGFGKDKALWAKNARPKEVLLTLLAAEPGAGAAQPGPLLMGLKAVAQSKATLLDHIGYQELPLPAPKRLENRPYVLVIEILSVYPGSAYEDCLISEVTAAEG